MDYSYHYKTQESEDGKEFFVLNIVITDELCQFMMALDETIIKEHSLGPVHYFAIDDHGSFLSAVLELKDKIEEKTVAKDVYSVGKEIIQDKNRQFIAWSKVFAVIVQKQFAQVQFDNQQLERNYAISVRLLEDAMKDIENLAKTVEDGCLLNKRATIRLRKEFEAHVQNNLINRFRRRILEVKKTLRKKLLL